MRLALLLAVAALAGCALKTAPTRTDLVAEALPKGTRIPPAWRAEAQGGEVVNDWLRSFDDPMLDAIVAEAIENNLDLRQAAERVRIAQQNVVVAGAQLLPQIGLVLGGRTTRDEDHDSNFNAGVAYAGVAWELDVWGRLRAQRAAAQAGAAATGLDYAYARQSLAATVAKAWYLASEARQLLGVAQQSVQVYGELLALVKIRREAGKDTDLDVVDTTAKLDFARAQVETARQAYEEAQRALEVLLGRYPAAEIEATAAFPPLPPSVRAGAPAALLERRPDLVAAEQQVLKAFRAEESAELALLPDLSISLAGGLLGDPLLSVLRLNPWLASAGIGVSIPIFEGGALRAKVKIATAQQAQAVAHYGEAALVAFREAENAIANEQLLARRLPYEQNALASATEAVRIATIQYRAGRRDLLWVSNLQTSQIAAQALVIQLQGQQRANRVRLHLALGGSYDAAPAVPAVPLPVPAAGAIAPP